MTPGYEELIQKNLIDARLKKLNPEPFGDYGRLQLGSTTFNVLKKHLSIQMVSQESFTCKFYKAPNPNNAKPDDLIIRGKNVVCIIEHKTPGSLKKAKEKQAALEQLNYYLLICDAKLGAVSDGNSILWIHNLDKDRKNTIKAIQTDAGDLEANISEKIIAEILDKLDPQSDQLKQTPEIDPSDVARSVWQAIYIATRQTPEKCFQTFVELFMYKLISEYELLPKNMRMEQLCRPSIEFYQDFGFYQIDYYLDQVRTKIKSVFPETCPPINNKWSDTTYNITRNIVPQLINNEIGTSVINGHAFQDNRSSYNEAFVNILRKLSAIENIKSLDRGFKSRIYESFLRRDPNSTKISGKYLTPRNIVKTIVNIAKVDQLPEGSVICDPACGVGGFLTETVLLWDRKGIPFISEQSTGKLSVKRKLVGFEVQHDVTCLAKANFVLHVIELFASLSEGGRKNFQKLLGDIFIYAGDDPTLGSLYYLPDQAYDLVMANPPYIVSGTSTQTKSIKSSPEHSMYYDAGGTGLESRFVNQIVKSLKPNAKAFIVLPKTMLARVETGIKSYIRQHCFIDALAYLPPNSFYTTPAETYVVCITKKATYTDQKNPVLVYYIREIGETRDTLRKVTSSDLGDFEKAFRQFQADPESYSPEDPLAKKVDISRFAPENRWDFDYLWSVEQLTQLGVVDRPQKPLASVRDELEQLALQIETVRKDFKDLALAEVSEWREIDLSDQAYFEIIRGKRVTKAEVEKHPGEVLVIASGRHEDSYFGWISNDYLKKKFDKKLKIFNEPGKVITLGSTGSVGIPYLRSETNWFLHDDAIAIRIVNDALVPEYVRFALEDSVANARFDYTAKLYEERLKSLTIRVPIGINNNISVELQERIAGKFQTKKDLEMKIKEVGKELQLAHLLFDSD
ncbi:MAG: N-6 DNA methylase [Oceanicaulis sp.]